MAICRLPAILVRVELHRIWLCKSSLGVYVCVGGCLKRFCHVQENSSEEGRQACSVVDISRLGGNLGKQVDKIKIKPCN